MVGICGMKVLPRPGLARDARVVLNVRPCERGERPCWMYLCTGRDCSRDPRIGPKACRNRVVDAIAC